MAESWFLNIDGIDGESTDDAHPGELEILSWSWGVTNAGSAGGPGGGGGGAGKASFQDFQFVARISKASPQLFLAAATGTHHATATLSGMRVGGKTKGLEFLTYKLTDVQVTSAQHSDNEGGPPMDAFALGYRKIEISYRPQLAKGQLGDPVRAGFDVKTNKKI